ncbi:uncharacterized protein METZ01_LOCUS132950, partial [marine metagenome]|jgi:chorismate mutase|tara:strand:+ start:383 stop:652 length:270 start_codon:yes stop_codon:yes gene_type:complete
VDSKVKIKELRKLIDKIDDQLFDLLVERFDVSKKIGDIKASKNINIDDPNREQEIIDRLSIKLEGKLKKEDIETIIRSFYYISKKLQKK